MWVPTRLPLAISLAVAVRHKTLNSKRKYVSFCGLSRMKHAYAPFTQVIIRCMLCLFWPWYRLWQRHSRLMLCDTHPSVQPHVKCHKAFLMMCKTMILCVTTMFLLHSFWLLYFSPPLPAVSTLIPLYITAAMLLHYPGDRVHVRSLLAFPNSSAVPSPMPMNKSNSINAHWDLVPPLVAVLLFPKFLH
jgi:hypothetical protein